MWKRHKDERQRLENGARTGHSRITVQGTDHENKGKDENKIQKC